MPLHPKPYQPYFLDPNSPNRYGCAGEYLYPIIPTDIIYWQGYQTPCGVNLVEDPGFENVTLGAELLTNGSFTGSAASWTLSGGFAYDTNNVVYTPNVLGGVLSQGIAISLGDTVVVGFTTSGNFNGGFMLVYLGTTIIATVTDPGTYTFSGVYDSGAAELIFEVYSSANSPVVSIAIDDVSAKTQVLDDWDGNEEWAFADGVACKQIAGTGTLIETVSNYIVSGRRYRLTFTLSGNATGTITPKVGSTPFGALSGNGIKTVWVNATGNGVLEFLPSADFTGCISEPDVREMKRASDFVWQIISELGDGDVYDIASYVEEYEDNLTLIYDPLDDSLPFECYILRIFDTCTVQYEDQVLNGTFFGGTVSSCPDWGLNNADAQYDLSGDQAEFLYSGSLPQITTPLLFNTPNPLLVDGNYLVSFDIISNSDTTNIGVKVRLRGDDASQAYYSTVGTHTFNITGYAPSPAVIRAVLVFANFGLLGADTAGSVVVDNVQVFRTEPFTATYTSEGLIYRNTHENTRIIRAYCDVNNFGYEFENSGFYLQQRVLIRSINPDYLSSVNIAQSGNGNGRITYAEQQKYFNVHTGFLDESAHDALSLQLKCDHFEIQNQDEQFVEYLSDGDQYEPQWFPSGVDMTTAPAVFRVRIKDGGQIFNRHY